MSATTITLGSTTHEETSGALTACGLKVGPPSAGWRHPQTPSGVAYPVNCSSCLRVRAAADAYMEKLS